MRKVFWDRLIVPLTPPKQAEPGDFELGAKVQCGYGETGALYSATIVGRDEDEPVHFAVC